MIFYCDNMMDPESTVALNLPDNINEQIAEWCGWIQLGAYSWRLGDNVRASPPAYSTDLNACAEFEALLEAHHAHIEYDLLLCRVVKGDLRETQRGYARKLRIRCTNATAPQRCAALLAAVAALQALRLNVQGVLADLPDARAKGEPEVRS
jgi:hypothetical protein